ncbi:hypothetical protein [Carboxydothermus pertinax]|nr:hypothetical protein [Carboxydothermus pertinax]
MLRKSNFLKQIIALILTVSVLSGGLVSVVKAETIDGKGKGNIAVSYSNNGKTLKITKDGSNMLFVTRKTEYDGIINFKDSKGNILSVIIKVTPLPNGEYNLTIKDEQTSEVFHVKSRINPLSDIVFNKPFLTTEIDQQQPYALAYYLWLGQKPSLNVIIATAGSAGLGKAAEQVGEYIVKNWSILVRTYQTYGFWSVVYLIAAAPELSAIGIAVIAGLVM